MSEVVSVDELVESSGLPAEQVADYLQRAKVKEIKVKVAGVEHTLYTPTAAKKAIRLGLAEDVKKAKAALELNKVEEPEVVGVAVPVSVSGKEFVILHEAIMSIKRDVAVLGEAIRLVAKGGDVLDKNLRGLGEALSAQHTAKDRGVDELLHGIQKAIEIGFENLRYTPEDIPMKFVTSDQADEEAPAAPSTLRRVGIVGLFSQHHAALKKEFAGVLDLTILNPDEARKGANLKSMDRVFAMVKHIGHQHMDTMTAAGIEAKLVTGALSSLRSSLKDFAAQAA